MMNKTKVTILTLILLLGVGIMVMSGAPARIVIVANPIDYDLASGFIEYLENEDLEVVHSTAAEFEDYKEEEFIVILGGPDAYEGVGEIVKEILSEDEQNAIREKGNRKMYLITDAWSSGQNVMILAGSDRNQTKKSHEENRGDVSYEVDEAYEPTDTLTPSPTIPPSYTQSPYFTPDERLPAETPPEVPLPTPIPPPLPGSKWTNTFGGIKSDTASTVRQTNDGGYIIVGFTESFGAGNSDVYLVKTGAGGNEMWSKTFGGKDFDAATSVQQTSDGGYIIAGYTESFGVDNRDVYLIKTDGMGNEVWSKTLGGKDFDAAASVQQTSDGGYIIAGYTESFNSDLWGDVYLIKTDTEGNEIWNRTFGGGYYDFATSVQQTSDGGYIIAGYTYPLTMDDRDAYLIKTDTEGNEVWSKTFGDTERDRADSVQQTSDGGYIIAGSTQAYPVVEIFDVYLIKTDSQGNEVWNRTFGDIEGDSASSVQQTSDGGYIIAGITNSFDTGLDVYLIKTNSQGDEVWNRTFGGANHDSASSVQQTSDGGYIIAGFTKSFGAGDKDVFLIKVDS